MKNSTFTKVAACAVSSVFLCASAQATLFTDDASDPAYGGGSWASGSNGGTGFSAWNITATPGTGFAGTFTGDSSTGLGGSTALNTSGVAFGAFANSDAAASVDADRDFLNGALSVGDNFSIELGVNFRNGFKGLNLLDAGNANLFTFLVGNVGGGDDYVYADDANAGGNISLGLAYEPDSIFTLTFTQTTATDLNVQIVRNSANSGTENALNSNFTISGAAGFKLFINGNSAANGDPDNLYANNLVLNQTVVPEASTVAMFGVASLVIMAVRRRRVAD